MHGVDLYKYTLQDSQLSSSVIPKVVSPSGKTGFVLVNLRIVSDQMSCKHFTKDLSAVWKKKLSGYLSVGLVKNISLPDRMSGKNPNTFGNTKFIVKNNKPSKWI